MYQGKLLTFVLALFLVACASEPKIPYSTDFDPLAEMPQSNGGITDGRGRFREIFCAVLEDHGQDMPDYRPCDEALTRVGQEPSGSGREVDLGKGSEGLLIGFVPGLGWECIKGWLKYDNYGPDHIGKFGYEAHLVDVDGLSGTEKNGRMIRDIIDGLPPEKTDRKIILIGYSKGTPDVLEFIAKYPDSARNVVAVISVAGAVWGSPLALEATQDHANILTRFPGSKCDEGDGGAVNDLRPDVREQWLTDNPLPDHIRYYSVVAYPDPSRMSFGLKSSWKKLGELDDARNDSQVVFYDQVIPGSTLMAFPNADHWAMAVPVARVHAFAGHTFVNKNDYPREAFLEAVIRFVDEDLSGSQPGKP